MNILSVRLKNFHGWVSKHQDYSIYICIALTVIVFNLIVIFGLNVLMVDDLLWYRRVINGKFPEFFKKYSILHAYKEWLTWNIMAYSPTLIRGLYVVFLMIPLSFCFYYLYHSKFGFSRLTAFTAAILPNILPFQWQIPAIINLSYTLWGLLFSVFSLILGLHYLGKTTSRNWIRLLGAVMCYLIAIEFMAQSLFIFPALVLAFLGYTKFNKKHILLISSFFILVINKLIWMIAVPRQPITNIPVEQIFRRLGIYLKWSLPSPAVKPLYLTIIYIIIIFVGFILYIRDFGSRSTLINKRFHINKKVYVLYFYAFFICWSASSILVFASISKPFTERYAHISSFGINAIFVFSIYVILNRRPFKKYKLHIFIFLAIIIFSGTFRYVRLKKDFTFRNSNQSIIIRDLNKLKLPLHTQIVIAGVRKTPPGWGYSSGYLNFALKRKDLNGLIGPINYKGYYNFDNHFDSQKRNWGNRYSMTGLSMDRPTFLFLMLKKQKKLKQLEYALQWKGKTKNAPWTILKANKKTGKISPFMSGIGMKEYLLTLKKLEKSGISQSAILWGGPPCKKELERMEFDPIFFKKDFDDRFKYFESSRAKHILLISSNTTAPIAKKIYFGNGFQVMSYFPTEVTLWNGKVGKIIYILWKSMIRQKINKNRLAITLLKNRKKILVKWLRFCQPGLELEAGDYIFGSVKIPVGKFKQAENLGIGLFVASGPKKWIGLKIQGNHKTDQKGFRLLIPIKNANK